MLGFCLAKCLPPKEIGGKNFFPYFFPFSFWAVASVGLVDHLKQQVLHHGELQQEGGDGQNPPSVAQAALASVCVSIVWIAPLALFCTNADLHQIFIITYE